MYINRVKEIENLRRDFEQLTGKSRFLILSGSTGIGKSELTNQAFGEYERFVRVKVAKHEGSRNIPCLHIKELSRAINFLAIRNSNVLTFKQHFKKNKGSIKSLFFNIVGDAVEEKYKNRSLGSWIRTKGEKDKPEEFIDTIISADDSDAFIAITKYIKDELKKERYIIALENIQNIDKESLIFLKELLATNSSLYIVAEYTEDDNKLIDKFELQNYFSGPYINTNIVPLGKLLLKDIMNACIDKPELIISILEDSYERSTGNLHNLQILLTPSFSHLTTTDDSQIDYEEIIVKEINSLNSNQAFILTTIVVHGGKVDKEILQTFIKTCSVTQINIGLFSIKDFIEELILKKLLIETSLTIEIAQDSIIEKVLTVSTFKKYVLLGYREWLNFYQKQRAKESDIFFTKAEIISWEIFFRASLEDISGVNTLLNDIYYLTLISTAPKRAIGYLEKIKTTFKKNISIVNKEKISLEIDSNIIRILFRLWYFEEIPQYSKDHLDNPLIFLFHTSALALIGKAEEAIELCNQFIYQNDTEYQLGAFIVRMAAYRASNRYDECETEWIRLERIEVFRNSPYEAMFLRCADFALMSDSKKIYKYLDESISRFEKTNQVLQEISARNALAQHLGYDGDLNGAKDQLDKSIEKAKDFFLHHFALENNLCVLRLQQGMIDVDIIDQLQTSLSVCESILDRFIIWNNMLIAYSMLGQKDNAEATIRAIEQKIFNNEVIDFDLQRIAFYNAYIHYNKIEYYDISNSYLERAKALPVLADEDYWDIKLNGKINSKYKDFRLTLEYYPVYITYWHFDFDNVQDNYQLEA